MSNGKVIDRAFLAFLTYILAAVVVVSALDPAYTYPRTFLSIYFVGGTFLAWVLGAFPLFTRKIQHPSLKQPIILLGITLVLAMVYAISRYISLRYNIIWQDELTQFLGSAENAGPSYGIAHLSEFSIDQQQPPLDYYLTRFSYNVFGYEIIAIKFHAVLFGGAATLLLFWVMDEWTKHRWLSASVALMFSAVPMLAKYSLEARPLSLAVLTSLFVLYYTFRFWQQPQDKWSGALLLSSAMVMVTAIGLQPEIFMIVLFLCVLIVNAKSQWRKHTVPLLLVYLGVAVYFLPYFYLIYVGGIKYNQFHPVTANWIWETLKKISYRPGLAFLQPWPLFNFRVGLTLLGLMALAFLLIGLKKEKRETIKKQFAALFLFVFIFPIVFNFIFETFINWANLPHYRIVYAAPFMVAGALAATVVVDFSQKINVWLGKSVQALFVASFLGISFYDYSQGVSYMRDIDHWKVDLASVYGYLKKEMGPDEHYFVFTFSRLGDFPHPAFIGGKLFLSPEVQKARIRQPLDSSDLNAGKAYAQLPGAMWVLVNEATGIPDITNFFIESFKPFGAVKRFQNATVLKVSEENRNQFIEVIKSTIDKFPGHGDLWTLHEFLYSYYSFRRETATADKVLKSFLALHVDRKENSTGHVFDEKEFLSQRKEFIFQYMERKLLKK